MTKCVCDVQVTSASGCKNAFNFETVIGDAVVIKHIFCNDFSNQQQLLRDKQLHK